MIKYTTISVKNSSEIPIGFTGRVLFTDHKLSIYLEIYVKCFGLFCFGIDDYLTDVRPANYHRTDGPAVIGLNGNKYYLDGVYFSSSEKWFERLNIEQKIIALMNPENFIGESI